MISVADLLTDNRIPGNYFSHDAYVRGDLELGLLENRRGDRLLALPETLLEGIYAGLDKETGQAARLVLFNCGRWWGKNFYARFSEELSDYYGKPLSDMEMIEFLQSLKQCWVTHGLGRIDLDQSYQTRGFLIFKIWESPFAKFAPKNLQPFCFLEAGVLTSFLGQLTGKDIYCVQTQCESMGADCNLFVAGLRQRVEPIEAMVAAKMDHEAIMQKLCNP